MFPDNQHPDQYLWQSYAAAALSGILTSPQRSEWRNSDLDNVRSAAHYADAMVAEYRKRWPWQNPYPQPISGGHYPAGEVPIPTYDAELDRPEIAQDTLRANPEYGTFHKVAKRLGLIPEEANRLWSNAETNADAWSGLISEVAERGGSGCDCALATDTAEAAQMRGIEDGPLTDGNGHSYEALGNDVAQERLAERIDHRIAGDRDPL